MALIKTCIVLPTVVFPRGVVAGGLALAFTAATTAVQYSTLAAVGLGGLGIGRFSVIKVSP